MSAILAWLSTHQTLLTQLVVGGFFVWVLIILFSPLLVARIPADYFHNPIKKTPPRRSWTAWLVLKILTNFVGFLVLAFGLLLLVTPGPGVLFILLATMLIDYPKKYQFQRWLVAKPKVFRSLNWLRAKAKAEPLEPIPPS